MFDKISFSHNPCEANFVVDAITSFGYQTFYLIIKQEMLSISTSSAFSLDQYFNFDVISGFVLYFFFSSTPKENWTKEREGFKEIVVESDS